MKSFKISIVTFLLLVFLSGFGQTKHKIADTTFVDVSGLETSFILDLKYATKDNFLNESVYDCGKCFLRYKTALALIAAQKELLSMGYRIRLFDCYRPHDVQKKMYKLVPNPKFVAHPDKGSVHNRGGAVDLTLETLEGIVLDMGSAFDHFGPESSTHYTHLSNEVLQNRKLLLEVMKKHGFDPINSEWWHFNFRQNSKDSVSNFKWNCD